MRNEYPLSYFKISKLTTGLSEFHQYRNFSIWRKSTSVFSFILLFTLSYQSGFSQCQDERVECGAAFVLDGEEMVFTGNGPDPCLAKLYCSNNSEVPDGLIDCDQGADTDGCGIVKIADLGTGGGDWNDLFSGAECATGSNLQWVRFSTPPKVAGAGQSGGMNGSQFSSQVTSWWIFYTDNFEIDPTGLTEEELQEAITQATLASNCDDFNEFKLVTCTDMNQWIPWENPDAVIGDNIYNVYYVAVFYENQNNPNDALFKMKDCFIIDCPPMAMAYCPEAEEVAACQTQEQVNGAFDAWIGTFEYAPMDPDAILTWFVGPSEAELTMIQGTPSGELHAPDECGGVVYVKLQVENECDESISSCVSSFTVVNNAPPLITCPSDVIIDCDESTQPSFTGMPTCEDDCENLGSSYSDQVDDTDPCGVVITRTWTCMDACGNTDNCVQTITLVDNTPPVISCPPNVTIDCNASTDPANTGSATCVSDDCNPGGGPTYSDSRDASDPCAVVISRTWTCTDACGNSSTCVQTITLVDNTPPVISCPPNVTIDCNASTDPANTGSATCVSDDCNPGGGPTYSDSRDASDPCAVVISRTWTCTDACGNSSTCVQTITLVDNTPPVISCPPNVTIDCNASTDPANTGSATCVSDDCNPGGGPTYSDSRDASDPCAVVISRTWTCTDACGNSSTCVQTITLVDNTPPVISCPPNVTIDCNASTDPANTGSATCVSDDCNPGGGPTYSDSRDASDPCAVVISRTWTCTDACGNSSTCVQTITLVDNTPPVISCPPNVAIDCNASTDPANTGSATCVSDDCNPGGGPTYSDSRDASDPCAVVISRTWTCTDACGNSSTCVQTITLVDNTPPVISCPPNVTIDCNASTDPANTGSATCVSDDCNPGGGPTYSDSRDASDPCAVVISRTWTCTDACGNSSTCVQTITLVDNTPPVISCPPNVTIDCNASTDPANTGSATCVSDDCNPGGGPTYSDSRDASDPCAVVISRTWTCTDACGNSSTCVQTITLVDNTPPVISCPPNVTIDCNASTDPANTGSATCVSDDCNPGGGPTYSDAVDDSNPCAVVITRTWTCTDACGNSSTCVQTITIVDDEDPTFDNPPANTTLVCEVPGDPPTVTASDNCPGDVQVDYLGQSVPDLDQDKPISYCITRRWKATDACGNTAFHTQEICVEQCCEEETAFAFQDGNCFNYGKGKQQRWGWFLDISQEQLGDGEHMEEFELVAAAGRCEYDKGTVVGKVVVEVDGDQLTVTYMIDQDPPDGVCYELGKVHVNVACDVPTKHAPGQYNSKECAEIVTNGTIAAMVTFDLTDLNCIDDCGEEDLNIVAHAEVEICEPAPLPSVLPDAGLSEDEIAIFIQGEVTEQQYLEPTVLAYPNPASHYVDLELSGWDSKSVRIEVRDIIGRVVMEIGDNMASPLRTRIDFGAAMTDGLYYIHVQDQQVRKMIPLVIIDQ